MNWRLNWREKLHPKETQFKDISLEQVKTALRSQSVQEKWFGLVVTKLQNANFEIDRLMDKPDKDRIWEAVAIERRTILRCLTMVLDARDELESERLSQEAQDRILERYKGASAPLIRQ